MRVTRSFPIEPGYAGPDKSTDHPHHTGIYVAHGEVNGVNHWGGRSAGKQLHKEFPAIAGTGSISRSASIETASQMIAGDQSAAERRFVELRYQTW